MNYTHPEYNIYIYNTQYGQINEWFLAAKRNWPKTLYVLDAEEYFLTGKKVE